MTFEHLDTDGGSTETIDAAGPPEQTRAVDRTDAVDEEIAARLRLALAQIARELRRTVGESQLTQTEAALVGTIGRRGPVRVQDLARAEGLNQTMVSRLVVDLERRGELVRRRDQTDRRLVWVELSASGRRLYTELRASRARILAAALTRLGEPSRTQIVGVTSALELLAAELRERPGATRRAPGSTTIDEVPPA